MKFALGLTLIGWMCLPATAQTPIFDDETGNTILWGAGTWTGPVTRMESGDFTADLHQDVVLQEGSTLVLAFGAAIFKARSQLESGVTDFCVVPTNSGVDVLVASTATGWARIKVNYGLSGHVQSIPFTNEDWEEAKFLRTLVQGNQPARVIALDSTGERMLVLSSPVGLYPSSVDFELENGPGLALAVLDWEGDGEKEVAVMHAAGLDIYDPDSQAVVDDESSTQTSVEAFVPFHQEGVLSDRLAALVIASGSPALRIYDPSGVSTVTLVADLPYALAAGDLDGDESDDLIVAHGDETEVGPLLYLNGCTGGSCSPFTTHQFLDLGVPWTDLSAQAAIPILDDFTADGDKDLVWFSEEVTEIEEESYQVLRVAENSLIDHGARFIDIQITPTRGQFDFDDPAGNIGNLRLKFLGPATPLFASNNYLFVEEWYQHAAGVMQSKGARTFEFSYPGNLTPPAVGTDWSAPYDLFLWPSWVPENGITHLVIREARKNASGVYIEAGPPSLHSIALTTDAIVYLSSELPTSTTYTVERDWTDIPEPNPPLGYPEGEWPENTFHTAGIGTPVNLPPIEDGPPPKKAPNP